MCISVCACVCDTYVYKHSVCCSSCIIYFVLYMRNFKLPLSTYQLLTYVHIITIRNIHNLYTCLIIHLPYTHIYISLLYSTTQRVWFRKLFPVFMKYVTGGYVGEEEAGERLAQVVDDERCRKSGMCI